MINYDKEEVKKQLTLDDTFSLLQEWGGDPIYTSFGIISTTICHNPPGEGSRKLYFYSNSGLFRCFTGCDAIFDQFELCMKVARIQWHEEMDLNQAVRWVAKRFGIAGTNVDTNEQEKIEDWQKFANYERIQELEIPAVKENVLKQYDKTILDRFNYFVKIDPWLREGISQSTLENARIGFYPGNDQITIPHWDKDGNFVGLRGRTLCKEEADMYGKYRPMKVNKQMYNHPLGMNLYGYNWSKDNIKIMKKAIVFESEKSVLMYASYFGWENNISVACCGSSLSAYQMQLLIDAGATEIIVAFDRQFQEIGDNEFKHLKTNLLKLKDKYGQTVSISFIFDKNMITGYKASPIDEGPEKFLQLFKERIVL